MRHDRFFVVFIFCSVIFLLFPAAAYLDAILIGAGSFPQYLVVCVWESFLLCLGVVIGVYFMPKAWEGYK